MGFRPAIISGVSMEPGLEQGDVVFTRPADPAALKVGDVIRFRQAGVPIIHRIRTITPGPQGPVFETRGDNNNYADAPVPASAVEGRVELVLPKIGLLPIALRQLIGR
jgi:signal peptidase